MSNIARRRIAPEVRHVSVTGPALAAERSLAWVLWGPLRRVVDRSFRREWKAGGHRIEGRVPWRSRW